MAIVKLPTGYPLRIGSTPPDHTFSGHLNNAANENSAVCGYLILAAGSGTKTLSAAGGGKITVAVGAVTFATATTEYRVGLEDITAGTGIPDGTQDVYGAKVAVTDTIAANSLINFTMTSGSKTVSHGDFLAITGRMPVRAGADAITFGSTFSQGSSFGSTPLQLATPYGILNGTKEDDYLWALITFDDGTLGWIYNTPLYPQGGTTITGITTAATPDEYAATFTVPISTEIDGIGFALDDDGNAGDDYEVILYSDPLGTPAVIEAVAVDSSAVTKESNSVKLAWGRITPVTLAPSTTYGIALRVTGGTISTLHLALGTGFSAVKTLIPYVLSVKLTARSNQSGAFAETADHHCPIFAFSISGLATEVTPGGGLQIAGGGGLT